MNPVFTPATEPYLGRESVFHFDQMIIVAMEQDSQIAPWTIQNKSQLSPLQIAACQLLPHGFSISLSIRELVRQGYLYSALILLRPLIERAAIISYLTEKPEKIPLWEKGWPYKSRPSLKEMLLCIHPESDLVEGAKGSAIQVCDYLNSIIHGDPVGSLSNISVTSSGEVGYLSSKMLNSPDRCDEVCFQAACWLIILFSRAVQIFPDALSTKNRMIPTRPKIQL